MLPLILRTRIQRVRSIALRMRRCALSYMRNTLTLCSNSYSSAINLHEHLLTRFMLLVRICAVLAGHAPLLASNSRGDAEPLP
jgi:hypothetical protein